MAKFKEQIKCPSHEQNLEKQSDTFKFPQAFTDQIHLSLVILPSLYLLYFFPPSLNSLLFLLLCILREQSSLPVWQVKQHIKNCSRQKGRFKFPDEFLVFEKKILDKKKN